MEKINNLIKINKVVLSCNIGVDKEILSKAYSMLELISNQKPIYSISKKTIKEFNIRKKAKIGVKVTLRKKKAEEILKKCFETLNYKINVSSLNNSSFSIGFSRYYYIKGFSYSNEIGNLGLNIVATFNYIGIRSFERKINKSLKSTNKIRVSRKDIYNYLNNKYSIVLNNIK